MATTAADPVFVDTNIFGALIKVEPLVTTP
jgi:hypothetical protein